MDVQESQETLDEVPVDQNNQEKIKSKTLVTLLSFLVRKMPYKAVSYTHLLKILLFLQLNYYNLSPLITKMLSKWIQVRLLAKRLKPSAKINQ